MLEKFTSFVNKMKFTDSKTQNFTKHLLHNFFGNVEATFQGEDHINAVSSFCFKSLVEHGFKDSFNIKTIKISEGRFGYCITMKDRPFVVDSVLGWIRSQSLHPMVFIHPNFYFNSKIQIVCF